jgi:ribosomal protein S18 acetylase RimI-like enzyme
MDQTKLKSTPPEVLTELVEQRFEIADLNDLCDATDSAIEAGGGFGWVELPARDILERYWQGVTAMPARKLIIGRLDGVICGTAQITMPPLNNQAQAHSAQLNSIFVAPWARKYGLARMITERAEQAARDSGFFILNMDIRETQQAAIALYESMGYVHIGSHPFYARINDEYVAGRYYYKVIASPDQPTALKPADG